MTASAEPDARIESQNPGSRDLRIRVAVIAPSLHILGGQAVQADRLVRRLRTSPSIDISFLPLNPRFQGVLQLLQRVKYVRTLVTTFAYVGALLRRCPEADVLHIFSASYWSFLLGPFPAMLVGRLFRKRVLLNYHSGEAEDHLRRWRPIVLPLLRLAHRIVVPSAYLVDVFRRFDIEAFPIPNFVEIDAIPYRQRDTIRPIILSNRNLEPHYDVATVLYAFARIQQQYPDARLLVAGDGSQRGALEKLAKTLQLRHVEFLGQVSPEAMERLYDVADLYLNASVVDNMPLSIIEAQTAGLPVVTTNAGGIPYLAENEHTALLVDPGDHEALARGALRYLDDPSLARSVATAARDLCVARYGWSAVASAWVQCYRTLTTPTSDRQ